MALFTSKGDADLPLLTQFYQITIPPRLEGETTIGYATRMAASELGVWERKLRSPSDPMPDMARGDMAQLADLRQLVVRIMDAISDRGIPGTEDQEELDRWIANYMAPRPLAWVELRHKETLTGVMVTDGREHWRWEELLIVPILRKLHAAIFKTWGLENPPFKRCEECNNPFPAIPGKQRYCSRRCGSRAGERRRYAERFAEYKEMRSR